mmetsp:Transcript_8606/g.10153  ORF Transcript_8606/g.10153 Transcript_8606/m.10153 type:complete len:175 (+) Transcript_8606:2039-2563(+)
MTGALVFKRFSINTARRFKTFWVLWKAWSSLEVVALAIAVAVIEVPEIASYIVSDSCDFIVKFMQETLLPLGLVTEEDARAVCFGVNMGLEPGIYVLVVCALFSTILGFTAGRMFSSFIEQRRRNFKRKRVYYQEANTPGSHYTPLQPLKIKSAHKNFNRLELIKVFRVTDEQP